METRSRTMTRGIAIRDDVYKRPAASDRGAEEGRSCNPLCVCTDMRRPTEGDGEKASYRRN